MAHRQSSTRVRGRFLTRCDAKNKEGFGERSFPQGRFMWNEKDDIRVR